MKIRILAVASCLCLFAGGAALAQTSVGEKTGVNSVIGKSPTTKDFVTEAAVSDMFEIQSSQMALQKSDGATKSFATQMIADHQKTTDDLKALLQTANAGVAPPVALDKSHQKMLDKLGHLNGDAFTKRYHREQVTAHKEAVSLFRRYAKGGDNPILKDWAGKTLPTLQHHLAMARALDK